MNLVEPRSIDQRPIFERQEVPTYEELRSEMNESAAENLRENTEIDAAHSRCPIRNMLYTGDESRF